MTSATKSLVYLACRNRPPPHCCFSAALSSSLSHIGCGRCPQCKPEKSAVPITEQASAALSGPEYKVEQRNLQYAAGGDPAAYFVSLAVRRVMASEAHSLARHGL